MAHEAKWISADGDEPVTTVALRSLRSRLEPVQKYLPLAATKYTDDIEYVHLLRVWTRRAVACLDLYRDLLPEWRVAWIEQQLVRIRKATNDARDDDVFARRLAADNAPAASKLLKRVREHRVQAQQEVVEVYRLLMKKKGRFDRRVEKLLKRVRVRGKRRKSEEPTYRAWSEEYLRPRCKEFLQMVNGDLQDTESLHQFRIEGKRLRYAMELMSSAFSENMRKVAYPLLVALQDQLGKINDHASAIQRISHWIEDCDDAEQAAYLREMLKGEQQQLREAQERFSAWWSSEHQSQLLSMFDELLEESGTS